MGRACLLSLTISSFLFVGCVGQTVPSADLSRQTTSAEDQAFAAYAGSIHQLLDRATAPRPIDEDDADAQAFTKVVRALEHRRQTHLTNLINAETMAYKRQRTVQSGPDEVTTCLDLEQGPMQNTGRQLDVAIDGAGLFRVESKAGDAYTRSGNFFINQNGDLVAGLRDGPRVLPVLSFPPNTAEVSIAEDGTVEAIVSGSNQSKRVGRLELARFVNADGLRAQGNLFFRTAESGQAITSAPGEEGAGQIRQNFLEGSNVDVMRERVALIRIERQLELIERLVARYEQNAPAIASGD